MTTLDIVTGPAVLTGSTRLKAGTARTHLTAAHGFLRVALESP